MENLKTRNKEAALTRLNGNERLYSKLLERYETSMRKLLSELDVAVENQEHERIVYCLHSAKGIASTVGADSLAALCRSLEASEASKPALTFASDVSEVTTINNAFLTAIKSHSQ